MMYTYAHIYIHNRHRATRVGDVFVTVFYKSKQTSSVNGWVHHQPSDQSGGSSPQSAKVSALAGRPALGAASAAPPQLSGIAASGTLNCCSLGPQTLSLGPQDRSRAFDSLNWSLSDYRVDGGYGPSHSFTRYPVIGSVFETTSELVSRQYRTDTGRLA